MGRKWPRNRTDHVNTTMFTKMYNRAQKGLIVAGYHILLEELVHTDVNDYVVEEKEALGVGRLVTLKSNRPGNAFLMDKNNNDTHDKDNSRQCDKKNHTTWQNSKRGGSERRSLHPRPIQVFLASFDLLF